VKRDEKFVRPVEPAKLVGNSAKAREQLNWRPGMPFVELIREMTLAESGPS
jgi:GDP-D-mannose dehydratase